MAGRPVGGKFKLLKDDKKYAALCLICKKKLANTVKSILSSHCFVSGIALVFSIISLGTDQWVLAEGKFETNDGPSKINYGLFSGTYKQNLGGIFYYEIYATCLGSKNVCAYLCTSTKEERKKELQALYNNVPTPFRCPNVPRANQFQIQPEMKNVKQDNRTFLNFGLHLSTMIFLVISAFSGLVATVLSIWNTAGNPIITIFSIYGVFACNIIALVFSTLTLIMWGTLFAAYIIHNVGIYYTITGDLQMYGSTTLGYSYWLNIPSTCLYGTSIILLYLRQYFINQEPQIKIHASLSQKDAEIGKDNFCFLGYYKNYKEKINKFEVRDSDVYLVAHPKTGTTWAQEMIWLIVNDLNYETAQENILKRFPSIEYGAHYENETGLYDIDYMTYLNEMPSPRCIRSHLHWSLLPEQIKNGIKKPKIISVIRKVEDVCVSYYYHCKLLEGYIGTFEEFCKLFLAGRTIYGPFWKSVLSVWEQRHRFNILFLKYSDMKKDLVGVIKTVANYLERDLSEDAIQELSKHLSFDSMKNNSNVNFVPGFVRQGNIGGYRSEMSEAQIKEFKKWTAENTKGTDFEIQ
ncbi:hypothetical protein FQA39_LY04601 [Lamprigera yunnana]|nr:hypothetical protein FQA39_LY04601 [Lamprigera yunnana]